MRSPAKTLALVVLGVLLLAGGARTVAAQQITPRKVPPIPLPRALGAPVPAKREDGIDLAAVEKKFAGYIQEIQQADTRIHKLAGAKKCFVSNLNFFRTLPIEITLDTMRREGAARDAAHPWVRKVDVAVVDEQMARWRAIEREAEAAAGRIPGECGFSTAPSVDAILDRGLDIFTMRLMPATAPRQSGISTVVIDYSPWEASQRQLLDEYRRKRQYADDLEQQFAAKRAAWEAAEQRASASAALLNAATRSRDAALARARHVARGSPEVAVLQDGGRPTGKGQGARQPDLRAPGDAQEDIPERATRGGRSPAQGVRRAAGRTEAPRSGAREAAEPERVLEDESRREGGVRPAG